jgi:ATP-dependent Clp protease, protease subunit
MRRPLRPRKRPARNEDIWKGVLKDRTIRLTGPIDDPITNTLIAQILFLNMEDRRAPIRLLVNSPGGYINASMAIYDTIQQSKAPIHTHCLEAAHGTAALIVAAGAKGFRTSVVNGTFHLVPLAADAKATPAEMDHLQNVVSKVLAGVTGRTSKEVSRDMANGLRLPAEDAIDYGLVDRIVLDP